MARGAVGFPAAFWPADRAEGDVVVCLSEASPSIFAQLWGAPPSDALVCDVKAADPASLDDLPKGVVKKAVLELDRLVADPSARISELLAVLGGLSAAKR